jgi:hypothetical protein
MRIWSLHPKYLDTKGLVALWRETLLAKNVLEGKTKGYKNHPQLNRFKQVSLDAINQYLSVVYFDSLSRNYNFDKNKIDWCFKPNKISVTKGQIDFEIKHLLNKLLIRDPIRYNELKLNTNFQPHSLFKIIDGDIEDWEIIT